jgi:hypothetical protein
MANRTVVLLLLSLFPLVSGCYSTQEGRLKAGMPFSKDTITSSYELPLETIRSAAKEVLNRNGQLTNDDNVTKVMRGTVDGRTIWIKLDDTSEPKITKISVQARTGGGAADVNMASEIDKQIYGELIRRAP